MNSPITVILQKNPIRPKPVPNSAKTPTQPSIQRKNEYVKSNKPTLPLKNSKVVVSHTAIEKIENKTVATPNQPKTVGNIVNKNEAKRHLPSDWETTAKEAIRENVEKETLRNQRQGELWLKSPSDMHGKPRDYFDRQDKKAMLADSNESDKKSIFPSKKQKGAGQVIRFGKLCFHHPTFAEEEDIRAGRTLIGMLIPVSCEF